MLVLLQQQLPGLPSGQLHSWFGLVPAQCCRHQLHACLLELLLVRQQASLVL
jgi:hypothetical protein